MPVTASEASAAPRAGRPLVTSRPLLLRGGNPARLTAFVWRGILRTAAELGWSVTASPWSAPGQLRGADAAACRVSRLEQPGTAQVTAALIATSPSSLVLTADPDPLVAAQADAVERFAGAAGWGLCRPAGTHVLLDKVATRRLCARIGVPAAPGLEGEASDPLFRAAVVDLLGSCERLVLKSRGGWSGHGNVVVECAEQLARAWTRSGPDDGVAIAEAFVCGQEVSLELVAGRDTVTVVGWAVKGETGSPTHPVERLRFSPSCPPPEHLAAAAADLVHAAGYLGIVEVEYVVDTASGQFWLLEANPRTGGVTPLLAAGTDGRSSVEFAMRAEAARLAGQPAPLPPARRAAAEFTSAPHLTPAGSRPHARWVHSSIEDFRPHVYLRGDEDGLLRELALAGAHDAPALTQALGTLMDDAARIANRSPIPVRAGAR
jgi:Carbamoyl-phosphate synthase L chain, ATP binding domain